MKLIPYLLIGLLLTSAVPALAQQPQYISDQLRVTLRTGPSLSHKVIATLSTGDTVTIEEEGEGDWVRVKLPDGKEGWMISRYLTPEKPAALILAQQGDLGEELKALAREKQQLMEENQALKQARDAALKEARTSRESYQQLKADSGEVVKYRQENTQLRAEVDRQAAQLKELSETVESSKYATSIKWFLAGAGVLVVGWIMGWALGRKRRRFNSSLY